jgi:hypothetical protein
MTFENLTADAEALRQTIGFGKWAVLGHSFTAPPPCRRLAVSTMDR